MGVIVQRPFESDIFRQKFESFRIVKEEDLKLINTGNSAQRRILRTIQYLFKVDSKAYKHKNGASW